MNNDWKPEKNISSPWDTDTWENNIGQPVKPLEDNLPYPYNASYCLPKEVICECDMYGQQQLVISFYKSDKSPIPNRWIRFWTRVFFNTKWNFKK